MKSIKTLFAAAILAALPAFAQVQAASAYPLTFAEIYRVYSSNCGDEFLYSPYVSTTCDHGGAQLRVFVVEVGNGTGGKVTMVGDELPRSALVSSTPICMIGGQIMQCPPGVTVQGYIREYKLDGYQGGRFTYENTSASHPFNTFYRWIIIW